jgi:hypothetical protein
VSKVRAASTPLAPGQHTDLHPHAQSIAQLNRQLERADITLEDPETIEAVISQCLKNADPLYSDLVTRSGLYIPIGFPPKSGKKTKIRRKKKRAVG